MGATPYISVVPYEGSVDLTLEKAQALLNDARSTSRPNRPRPPELRLVYSPSGPPLVVNDIFEGAAGILEILDITDRPTAGFASPLSEPELMELFGTIRPTRKMAEVSHPLADQRESGHAVYVVLYEKDVPSEIMFIGCSKGSQYFSEVVSYYSNIRAALEKARNLETARRETGSYEEVAEMVDGTATVLDIQFLCDGPAICGACPFTDPQLLNLFGTTKPTRRMAESNSHLYDGIGRGEARYILLYTEDTPTEVLFAGYSVD